MQQEPRRVSHHSSRGARSAGRGSQRGRGESCISIPWIKYLHKRRTIWMTSDLNEDVGVCRTPRTLGCFPNVCYSHRDAQPAIIKALLKNHWINAEGDAECYLSSLCKSSHWKVNHSGSERWEILTRRLLTIYVKARKHYVWTLTD